MGRPDDELYRGARLAQALEWRERAPPTSPRPRPTTSAAKPAPGRRSSPSSSRRLPGRVNRRLRGLLVGAALLLVADGGRDPRGAPGQPRRRGDGQRRCPAGRCPGAARRQRGPGARLAAAAHHVEHSPESRAGLLAALARNPQLSAVRPRGGIVLEVSPDGRTLVTLDTDHRFWFHDTATLELVGGYDPYSTVTCTGSPPTGHHLDFDADGTRLAVALLDVTDGVVEVLDPATYEPVAAQPGGQPDGALPIDVKLSADGRYLAVSVALLESSAGQGHWVYVWDLTRPEQPLRRIEMPSDTFHIDFSHDGRLLYAAPAASPAPRARACGSTTCGPGS